MSWSSQHFCNGWLCVGDKCKEILLAWWLWIILAFALLFVLFVVESCKLSCVCPCKSKVFETTSTIKTILSQLLELEIILNCCTFQVSVSVHFSVSVEDCITEKPICAVHSLSGSSKDCPWNSTTADSPEHRSSLPSEGGTSAISLVHSSFLQVVSRDLL